MNHWFQNSCFLVFVIISWSHKCIALLVYDNKLGHSKQEHGNSCDFFNGSWETDDAYPLYNTSNCPFIEKEFDCQHNGRPDLFYLKYKWTPSQCSLPRFDGNEFSKMFRNKRILFVGDSLSLNQWQSLTCMLYSSMPQSNYTLAREAGLSTFSLKEYNISVMLDRNAFLVDLVKEDIGRVLKLDSIENGKNWKGYDLLIFNTWHWWLHKGSRKPWDYIQEGNKTVKDMDRLIAFKKGLTTWSNWVDANINPNTTKVFFQGISPTHYNGEEWNETKSTSCKGQTQPINGTMYPGGSMPAVAVVKEVLRKIRNVNVTLLDVTNLSQLRKDGHPSIYGLGGAKGNDCSHWCLAGVPDTWNELLYAILVTTQNIGTRLSH